jgi:integrase
MQLDLFADLSSVAGQAEHAAPEGPERPTVVASIAAGPVAAPVTEVPPARPQRPAEKPVAAPATLAEALTHYNEAVSTHPARVKICSAFRGVGRALHRPLDQIPADPEKLRMLLATTSSAAGGMKPRQWGEVKSLTFRGLRDLGVEIVPLRDETALSTDWAKLHGLLDRKLQIGLAKFMRFCTRSGVAPSSVCAATFEAFLAELQARSLHPNPQAAYRQTAKFWNRAAGAISAWPRVVIAVKHDDRQYALPWEAFPKAFVEDVEAFLSTKELGDEFAEDYSPKVRPATTKNRRESLRRVASVLVLTGTPAELLSLAMLCEIANVRAVLLFFKTRHVDQQTTEGDLNHAWLLRTIARFWLKDEAAARAINKLISALGKDVASRRGGMRPKNRQRLRQFDQHENFMALANLPMATLKKVARKGSPSNLDAVRVMYALQIAILSQAPMRSRNLVELEVGPHLIDFGKGARRTVRIHLPEAMTKTRRSYDAPLPSHLFPLLDAWLKTYRPRICPTPSKYLFPNARGELRNRDGVAGQLTKFLKQETGLQMNLHLFRHLAAKVLLDHDPNSMEVVRQVLGHSSTRTTERNYAELRTDPAFHALDATLCELTAKPLKRRQRPRGAAR